MQIRRLTYPCPDLEPLLRAFYDEHSMGGVRHMPLDEAKARRHVDAVLQQGVAFGVYCTGVLAGSVGLHESPYWWSERAALWDLWMYVLPEFRTTRAAFKLVDAAKKYAQERDLPLHISMSHEEDMGRKKLFFERAGFRLSGMTFMYGGA